MNEDNIHFYTLNVGQGDSHVIYFPNSKAAVIIDPGNGKLINKLLHGQLKINSLPFILITHGDMDHMSGINEVINKCLQGNNGRIIKPGYIFLNDEGIAKSHGKTKIKALFKGLRDLVKEHGLKLKCIFAEDDTSELVSRILSELGITGKIFYPQRHHMLDVYLKENYNLASVVMMLMFANKKILYTGDLPNKGWKEINETEDLKSDVFKVPHHGGGSSGKPGEDMKKILEQVNPNFALISVGSNKHYKHPNKEIIEAIVNHSFTPEDDKTQLFCTQMTDNCSTNRHRLKEKVEAFYREKYKKEDKENKENKEKQEEKEFQDLTLGNENGTMCAGTIRLTFNRDSADIQTLPKHAYHLQMLRTFFSNAPLPCGYGV